MKFTEINQFTEEELAFRARELRQERLNLRIQKESGDLERPSRLREIRRNLAKIETALSQRRMTAENKG